MRSVGWVVVGMLTAAAVLSLDPAVVGLSEVTPMLQVIALRGLLAAVLLVLGVGLIVIGAILLRAARRRGTRGAGPQALVLGLVSVLIAVGHVGVLVERGLARDDPLGATQDGAIDVLTLNTFGTAGGVAPVVALIEQIDPDVVALQETPVADADRIASLLGGDFQVFTDTTGPQPVQATALLVAESLGDYVLATPPDTTFGGVWARPADGDGPELFSVHLIPPMVGRVGTWRDELAVVTQLCARVPGAVVAGDLNATVDHATLRDGACVDGSVEVGGLGTWPTDRPALLGAPIDHVLADPGSWRPAASQVLDAPGAGDHRALLVRLVPAG